MRSGGGGGSGLLRELRRLEQGGELEGDQSAHTIRRLQEATGTGRLANKTSNSSGLERLLKGRALSDMLGASDAPPTTTQRTVSSDEALPLHLQQLKSVMDFMADSKIQLPVLRVLSPRSLRLASQLPAPNAAEIAKMEEFSRFNSADLYSSLARGTDRRKAREQRSGQQAGSQTQKPQPFQRKVQESKRPTASSLIEPPAVQQQSTLFERTDRAVTMRRELEANLESSLSAERTPHVNVRSSVQGKDLVVLDSLVTSVYRELGLDLDADFNRLRRVQHGAVVISLFWGRCRTAAAFCRLKRQTQLLGDERKRQAGLVLTRVARGHLTRCFVRETKRHAKLQREADRERARCRAKLLWAVASSAIVACVRFRDLLSCAKERRLLEAVRMIQRTVRGHQARARLRGALSLFAVRNGCAMRIQCAYRIRLARRKAVVQRKISAVMATRARLEMEELTSLAAFYGHLRRHGAALLIARAYRASVIRYRLHLTVYWNHQEKAVELQRLARGFLGRRIFRRVVTKAEALLRLKQRSVVPIQALARGHLARLGYPLVLERREKRIAMRKLFKLMAFQRSVLTSSKIRKRVVAWLRFMEPFRYIKLRENATTIQRVYRGHRGRVVFLWVRVRALLKREAGRWSRPLAAAINIQKVFRGHLARRHLAVFGKHRKAVTIQAFWRRMLAVGERSRLLRERSAKAVLLYFLTTRAIARRVRARIQLRSRFKDIVLAQGLARAYLARRRVRDLRWLRRLALDVSGSTGLRLTHMLAEHQVALLLDSMRRPIGRTFIGACGEECPLTGPLQALFVAAVGPKARTDKNALVTNRVDMKRLTKLLDKVPGLRADAKTVSRGQRRPVEPYDLASAVVQGSFALPRAPTKLSTTDLDITFTRCRSDLSVGKGLAFTEFIRFMTEIGQLHFKSQQNISDSGDLSLMTTKRVERVSERVLEAAGLVGLSMLVKVVLACHHEPWFAEVALFLKKESRAVLGAYVRRIQGLVRRRIAKAQRERLKALLKQQRLLESRIARVVLVQSVVRRFIHRWRVVRAAQRLLVLYVPHDGSPPYWHNPRTRKSTFSKPKVLAHCECTTVPLSAPGFEILVRCCNCPATAEVNCQSCLESFCSACFGFLHCKGALRAHVGVPIPMCSYCQQQQASKSCFACTAAAPDRCCAPLMRRPRSLHCDECFQHRHDPRDDADRQRRHHVLSVSRDLYLVRQQLVRRPLTSHRFEALVQPCEECLWRAAAQRCLTCDQVYCSACLDALHSRGQFSRHRAELLPYYSPSWHSRYLSDAALRVERQRCEDVAQRYSALFQQWLSAAVLRVQTWWRRIHYCRRGKAKMRERRLLDRKAYRLRKSDDRHFRNTPWYRVGDIFGTNPRLKSETREEQALLRLDVFRRQRAREYVWKNRDDWGFYRASRTEPRKGVPREGFSVGTVDELRDQARRGGFRLPGRLTLTQGSAEAVSTRDLGQFSLERCLVRVDASVFRVKAVRGATLTLDRKAYNSSPTDGWLLYLLPSKLHNKEFFSHIDRRTAYYRLRFTVYDSAHTYTAAQAAIRASVATVGGAARTCRAVSRVQQLLEEPAGAERWAARAEACLRLQDKLRILLLDRTAPANRLEFLQSEKKPAGALDAMAAVEELAPWIANHDQLEFRLAREAELSEAQLLAEAGDWIEDVNPMTRETTYIHRVTREMTFDAPAALRLRRETEAASEKKRQLGERRQQVKMMAASFKAPTK